MQQPQPTPTSPAFARRGAVYPLSVAPMMDCTDRHYRYIMRQITRHTLLYTEMITTGAILHGDRDKLLGFTPCEKPLALQVGGDNPQDLAACARIAADWGYDEINLNVGCPSDRVQHGQFGACLMARPAHVARCVEAMRNATTMPVTVKHRIGIEHFEGYTDLERFVATVATAGCDRFTVHARIAVLQGLSPRENRVVPPLRYDDVYRLKAALPHVCVEINGGITSTQAITDHLHYTDGVMIGRAAYNNPYLLATADALFYQVDLPPPTRRQVLEAVLPYFEACDARGLPATRTVRHLLGLFAYQRVATAWKRYISTNLRQTSKAATLVCEAMSYVPDTILDAPPGVPRATPLPGNRAANA